MTETKEKSFSRSLLKGTVLNLGLQLANRNLNKNNVWQTLLVGAAGGVGDYFLGNAAMGAILGSGNALVNKTKDFETAAKYAAIGGAADLLLNVAEAKAEEFKPTKSKYTDPKNLLKRTGVILAHGHYDIIRRSTYGENGLAQIELTENFQYKTMISAFELAQKTKTFKDTLTLFNNKTHSLVFMETDLTENGRYGTSECFMMSTTDEYNFTPRNNRGFLRNPSNYHFSIRVKLFPLEMENISEKKQIAKLAVVLGHELFIHSRHLEAVKLWELGKYTEALDKEMENPGFDGNIDHKLYMQGQKTIMNQYIKELKNIAASSKLGISSYDIQTAVYEHDKPYKYLLNQ